MDTKIVKGEGVTIDLAMIGITLSLLKEALFIYQRTSIITENLRYDKKGSGGIDVTRDADGLIHNMPDTCNGGLWDLIRTKMKFYPNIICLAAIVLCVGTSLVATGYFGALSGSEKLFTFDEPRLREII